MIAGRKMAVGAVLLAAASAPVSAADVSDAEVLAIMHKYDPEWIVVEQPMLLFDESKVPAAARLREVLKTNDKRFKLVEVIHYDSNHHIYRTGRLEIYRKLDRNPQPATAIELPVLGIGKSVEANK